MECIHTWCILHEFLVITGFDSGGVCADTFGLEMFNTALCDVPAAGGYNASNFEFGEQEFEDPTSGW